MIRSIMVVCEGNICRSPMAEGLLAHELPSLRISSAGCAAVVGRGADPTAIELMAERGIDISSHVAMDLNLEHVRSSDLILTMSDGQRRRIEADYPFAKGKVFRLCESSNVDVVDPYRKERVVFEMALSQIDEGASIWVEKVKRIIK